MTALALSPSSLRRSICRESFLEFVRTFWNCVVPEDYIENWHIPYLCNELQGMAERVFNGQDKEHDLIINIPPGTTKSTVCSIMFPAWVWTRMPTARTICGSYSSPLALDLSRKSRMVVQSEMYRETFPNIELREDQNTKGHFATGQGGGRIAVGVGGSITGFHAHFIIIDDPLDPKASLSEPDMKTADNWMRETLPTRKVDKAMTPTILIMQRLAEADPTGSWLDRAGSKMEGLKHIKLPAELDAGVLPKELEKNYKNGLLDPVRLSPKILKASRKDLGEYGYAGQFDQKPIPRGGGDFKTDLILLDTPPPRWIQRVRYWDKAGTKGGGAYTAGVLMGKCRHGLTWILDVKRGQWDAHAREDLIRHTAEVDGQNVSIAIEQEPGSGGKESAQTTVRNLAGFRVIVDRPVGDKRTRAYPFAAQVNGGTVRMVKGIWNTDYINELMYFPLSKYKDQVDASSGAFAILNKVKRRVGGL